MRQDYIPGDRQAAARSAADASPLDARRQSPYTVLRTRFTRSTNPSFDEINGGVANDVPSLVGCTWQGGGAEVQGGWPDRDDARAESLLPASYDRGELARIGVVVQGPVPA